MTDRKPYPSKAIEVRITVSGYDWWKVGANIRELADAVETLRENAGGCVACASSTSRTLEVRTREVTPEQFAEESIAWHEAGGFGE